MDGLELYRAHVQLFAERDLTRSDVSATPPAVSAKSRISVSSLSFSSDRGAGAEALHSRVRFLRILFSLSEAMAYWNDKTAGRCSARV